MSTIPDNGEDKRRRALLDTVSPLMTRCPLGHDNPAMCPLYDVRTRRRSTRTRWLDQLPTEDLHFIAEYHRICQGWQEAGCP